METERPLIEAVLVSRLEQVAVTAAATVGLVEFEKEKDKQKAKPQTKTKFVLPSFAFFGCFFAPRFWL